MQCRVERLIAAPREIIFAVAIDIPRWPEVISSIDRVEMLTPGPVAVGSRFRETRRMFGREATEEMTVTELAPPEHFVLTAENHGTRYRAEHLLAQADSATRLTLVFSGEPASLLARIMSPLGWLMSGHLKKQLEADLDDLKRAAERRAQQPSDPRASGGKGNPP
jgi:hypothetical protein